MACPRGLHRTPLPSGGDLVRLREHPVLPIPHLPLDLSDAYLDPVPLAYVATEPGSLSHASGPRRGPRVPCGGAVVLLPDCVRDGRGNVGDPGRADPCARDDARGGPVVGSRARG